MTRKLCAWTREAARRKHTDAGLGKSSDYHRSAKTKQIARYVSGFEIQKAKRTCGRRGVVASDRREVVSGGGGGKSREDYCDAAVNAPSAGREQKQRLGVDAVVEQFGQGSGR